MCLHVVNSRSHLLLGCDPLNAAAWVHGNPTGEGLRVPQDWGRRAWYREISLYCLENVGWFSTHSAVEQGSLILGGAWILLSS